MTGEMSIDYQYTKVLEERKEVLEDWSIDSYCIATRSARQEEEEEMSIGFDHSIAQSVRQEEEEVLSDVNERYPVFHQHTLQCAVMLFPLCGHYVSPYPSFFSIFTFSFINTFSFVSNHLVDQRNIFQIDQAR
jgi:hypothetical protein